MTDKYTITLGDLGTVDKNRHTTELNAWRRVFLEKVT
jgi:hypothetical protein